ncbi:MAG: DUF2157 domain-containing protein [Anaerolineae bacterium]
MAKQESLSGKIIEEWVGEGLISREQAQAISAYEGLAERRRVSPREIFFYVGGLFVLMAGAFGLQILWDDLRWVGHVVVIAVATLILWAAGEALRRREGPLLKRGAQASWLVAAWLTAILIGVTLVEWPGLDLKEQWLLLWASLGALPLAVIALLVLPGLPQGLAVGTLASVVASGVTFVIAETWGEIRWALYLPWLVVGAVQLAAAEVARRQEKGSLIGLFNLFGAWSCLSGAFSIALGGIARSLLAWDALVLIESLIFIAWSVRQQSRALLFSGGLWLFVVITLINFQYFQDQLGLPVVLLITGVAFIAIGLGVDRLRRRLGAPK